MGTCKYYEVCADFKCYWEKGVVERTGCNFIFINGAIGGMQTISELKGSDGTILVKRGLIKKMGDMMTDYSMKISDETLITGPLSPVYNRSFISMYKAGIFPSGLIISEAEQKRPLKDIIEDENLIVFGLADDEIGYILPENDFLQFGRPIGAQSLRRDEFTFKENGEDYHGCF